MESSGDTGAEGGRKFRDGSIDDLFRRIVERAALSDEGHSAFASIPADAAGWLHPWRVEPTTSPNLLPGISVQ